MQLSSKMMKIVVKQFATPSAVSGMLKGLLKHLWEKEKKADAHYVLKMQMTNEDDFRIDVYREKMIDGVKNTEYVESYHNENVQPFLQKHLQDL